ncbi:hypothetical protein CGC20_20010 [Leishmania donovani]|uniref:Uncharacterized protein n=1 Tax=Leishmania donovani TaxID=5661 RepID=A0A504XUN5_LEIDO|nr:hypothetical protein CGC20_20010 [Leishmania donovani]
MRDMAEKRRRESATGRDLQVGTDDTAKPRCTVTSEAANDEGEGRGGNTDSGGGDGRAADTVLTTLSPTMLTETGAASRGSATAVDGATRTRHLWMPLLPLQDLVKQFTTHLNHYGLTEHVPKALVGATAMVSAVTDAAKDDADSSDGELHRALEAFTQYAHETASVELSVDVFDSTRGAYMLHMHPLRAAAARAAKSDDAGETASLRHVPGLSIVRGCSGCFLHPLPGRRGASGWAAPGLSALREFQTAIATDSEGAAAAPANEDGGGAPALRIKNRHVCRSLRAGGGRVVVCPRAEHPGKHANAVKTTTELTGQNSWFGGACQGAHNRQLFAISWREDLAAARVLLADASALLRCCYEVFDTLPATSSPAEPWSPFSASSASLCGLSGLHMRAAVPAALQRGALFQVRGCLTCSLARSQPPLMRQRPSMLAARAPLALDRVFLKALPKLHPAILVLTSDVREDEVVPTTLPERVYSACPAAATTTAAPITASAPPKSSGTRAVRRKRAAASAGAGDAQYNVRVAIALTALEELAGGALAAKLGRRS